MPTFAEALTVLIKQYLTNGTPEDEIRNALDDAQIPNDDEPEGEAA